MSAWNSMSMAVKNTFIDVLEAPADGMARRRPSSTPPALRRTRGPTEPSGDDRAAAAQLLRLDAIVREGAAIEGLAAKVCRDDSDEASTVAPSPASGVARWSSADDQDDSPISAASSSPTSSAVGFLPSIGSAGHAAGTCRPCAFARSAAGCKFGAECSFCHIVTEHVEAVRMRPCKGKRERFKRTMAAIEEKVAQNPDLLSNGSLNLPAFVDRNPQARARVMAQLAQVAADAYRSNAAAP